MLKPVKIPFHQFQLLKGLLLVAILVRIWLLIVALPIGLGRDELQSVTHASLELNDMLKSVIMFDPHPPLYYLQLHYWLKFSTSDLWILFNSFTWGILTIVSLIWICTQLENKRAGILAGIICALGLANSINSVNVRMYIMMFFLSVWIWYFTHQFITGNKPALMGFGLGISSLLYLYSQGANFLIIFAICSYAFLLMLSNPQNRSRLGKFLLINTVIIILYLPWLIRAAFISVGHTTAPGVEDLAKAATTLLFTGYGLKTVFATPIMIVSSSIFLFLIYLLLKHRSSRYITISFILVPLIANAAISYLYRPIWVGQSISSLSTFLYIGIAFTVDHLLDSPKSNINRFFEWGVLGLYFLGVILSFIYVGNNYSVWVPLKQPVALVKQNMHPEDTVIIPDHRTFWGWSWYFIGPGSVNPLESTYDILTKDNIRIVGWESPASQMKPGQRYWIVRRSDNLTEMNMLANDEPSKTYEFGFTRIDLIVSAPD